MTSPSVATSSSGWNDSLAFRWDAITEFETRVVELVAQGLTNREIGQRLTVSRHTVDRHLRRVFVKLDVTFSRIPLPYARPQVMAQRADEFGASRRTLGPRHRLFLFFAAFGEFAASLCRDVDVVLRGGGDDAPPGPVAFGVSDSFDLVEGV